MLVEQRGKELCSTLQRESSSGKPKRNRRRSKRSMNTIVHQLFQTCVEVFADGGAGIVPSPQDVQRIRSILDSMKPEDVGLSQDMPYFKRLDKKGIPAITYLHVFECDKFSIGIFCLPPSGVIPLHNHPGMTVFSKVLFGSMHIKSYDWVTDIPLNKNESLNPSQSQFIHEMNFLLGKDLCHCFVVGLGMSHHILDLNTQTPRTRLAKVHTDAVFAAPCNTSTLYPASGGNMHCFTAVTACAVLDVLGPPYSDSEGRHCVYYRDVPCASFPYDMVPAPGDEKEKEERYAWLEEKDKPENFSVVGALYRGPRLLE